MTADNTFLLRYPHILRTAIAVSVTLLTVGCGGLPPAGRAGERDVLSPEEFAATQELLEQLLPPLEQAAAESVDLEIENLEESSCMPMEVREQQMQTRWLGELHGEAADDAAANAALDAVAEYLKSNDWTLDEDENVPDVETGEVRTLYLVKGHLNLQAFYERGSSISVGVFAHTECTDHPEDHKMLRSPLDPSYGNSSQYYLDGIDPTLDNY